MTFAVNMKLHLIHQSTEAVRFTSGVVCEINLPNYLPGTLLYIAAHLDRDTEGTLLLISACPARPKVILCQVQIPGQAMKDLGSLSRQRGTMPGVCVSTCTVL